jgi:eukaryotic-like serine/threonine-protein kinase
VRPGDLVANRFLLELQAGVGGMGKVFRARDKLSDAPVAIKVLLERRCGWDKRFMSEAETLSSLRHPGIVRHVAHGASVEGERYLVMEWLEGEELSTRLARGPEYRRTLLECVPENLLTLRLAAAWRL